MKKIAYIIILSGILLLSYCSLPEDDVMSAVSEANLITRFRIYKNVNEYFDASISQSDTTIVLQIPEGMVLTELYPEIIVSNGAVVTPASGEKVDMSSTVEYSVLAENKKSLRRYKVTVSNNLK